MAGDVPPPLADGVGMSIFIEATVVTLSSCLTRRAPGAARTW